MILSIFKIDNIIIAVNDFMSTSADIQSRYISHPEMRIREKKGIVIKVKKIFKVKVVGRFSSYPFIVVHSFL